MMGGQNIPTTGNLRPFVVLRTTGDSGEPELVRHPIDLLEADIASGVEVLRGQGLLDAPRTCLIAVSRGSLSGTFTYIYEVVRRCGWSVLPLGGSRDSQDISQLCDDYAVDTVFLPADALGIVFSRDMAGRFGAVRDVLCAGGTLAPDTTETVLKEFPHLTVRPFPLPSPAVAAPSEQ
jgi:hypothetical protein